MNDPMEQSFSSEANNHSASQEIRRLHYRIHNSPPLAPILSQMNPVHILPKTHSNINLPLCLGIFRSAFPIKIRSALLISSMRVICSVHPIPLDLVTLIIFGESYKLWSSSLCSVLQSPVPSSQLGPFSSSVPCSQTSSVCVLPLVWGTKFQTQSINVKTMCSKTFFWQCWSRKLQIDLIILPIHIKHR